MGALDNFVLDGQRLLLISGNNLNTNAKYRTEIENYNDISFKSPGYFEVKTKEGLTMEYGSTNDSKLISNGKVISWFISKVSDSNGNYMKYNYTRDISATDYCDIRLDKIEYGSNSIAGTATIYFINFSYRERPDIQCEYIYNVKTIMTRLLNQIEIKKGSTLLHKYEISYNISENTQSKITSIQLSTQNSHYNPTQILWGTKDNALNQTDYRPANLSSAVNGNHFFYSDFNGDGRTDFLAYNYSTKELSLYLNQNSSEKFNKSTSIQVQLPDKTQVENVLTADFNGDGFCDVLLIKSKDGNYTHQLYTYNGSTFTLKCTLTNIRKVLAGDFDGDGKYELLSEIDAQVLKFNNNTFEPIGGGGINWSTESHMPTFPNNRYLLDFNGMEKVTY